MLTPKQKAFANYYIECGGGGEMPGGDMGADEGAGKRCMSN